jgi:hypothetical protein
MAGGLCARQGEGGVMKKSAGKIMNGWTIGLSFFATFAASGLAYYFFYGRSLEHGLRGLMYSLGVAVITGAVATIAYNGLKNWDRKRK